MTITLELSPEEEARLSARARAEGRDLPEYVRSVLGLASDSSTEEAEAKTGAELLVRLKALNLPPGYGDPSIDSPELARQLREQFSHPNRSES